MKKITLLLMVLLMAVTANAKVKIGGLYYELNKSKRTAKVTYYKKDDDNGNANYVKGNLKIPKTVNYSGKTYTVTSIGEFAFAGTELTSVEIPNSVKSIGAGAFRECGLTSVVIPNSVTSIEAHAFDYCYALKSVVIPNSVTYIGDYAFADTGLTSVVIPNSVTYIGDYAFLSVSRKNVKIPKSVTFIGEGAFDDMR